MLSRKLSHAGVLVSFGVEPISPPGHSREGGNPVRGEMHSQWFTAWIPAFAGMTVLGSNEVWQLTPIPAPAVVQFVVGMQAERP